MPSVRHEIIELPAKSTYWHRSMRVPPKSACWHCFPSGRPQKCFFTAPAPKNAPSQPLRPKTCFFTASIQRAPGKNGQHLVLLNGHQKRYNVSVCCGGFHSRSTLSGGRSPGRTPPSVGARTPCPKAKARAGSNTRHGLPHSTCTPLTSLHINARQGRQH